MRGATRFGLGNRATLLFNPDSIRGPAFRRCRAEPPNESEVTMQTDSGAVSNLAAAMLARHARQCPIDGTAAGRSRGKTMMMLPISLTIAAGAALRNIWLAMRVSRTSRPETLWVGHGRLGRGTWREEG